VAFAESWWPTNPIFWMALFCGLYVLVYALDGLAKPFFDVVDGRISLMFLPAFIRVAAVLVAGMAGLLGVFAGSLFVGLFVVGDPPLLAAASSLASAGGIGLAYWLTRYALRATVLPFTLSTLLTLTAFYSTFNAIVHGLVWGLVIPERLITVPQLAQMIVGDFFGVVFGFVIVRIIIRSFNLMRNLNRHPL
jgi:hypothetical protein